ncbi:MAG: thioredoxin reductase [Dehalococcoidia bacterium]|nr:thioredoxin reductase [Dehalococcoidia bacterium]
MKTYDLLIAGRGAAAYAAALYAGRYRLDTVLVGDSFGGETAIGGVIENYPGQPEIDGFDLMMKFREQVEKLEVPAIDANLSHLRREGDAFTAELTDGQKVRARSVILAIGRERRKLNLPHEVEWMGKGVSYCSTCDAPLYRGKDAAAVVGGGSAAVEGAILIAKYARTVYLIYRREKFTRPEPVLIQILEQTPNVKVLYTTEVKELIGSEASGLTHIRISKPFGGQDVLKVDGLFVEAGADPRVEVAKELGMELNGQTGEVHVDRLMCTNVRGVYAAGDLTDSSGPLKQTVTAAAQGAIAALSAYQYVSEHKAGHGAKEAKQPAHA